MIERRATASAHTKYQLTAASPSAPAHASAFVPTSASTLVFVLALVLAMALSIALSATLFASPAHALAKQEKDVPYLCTSTQVVARANTDGSLRITETDTFEFSDECEEFIWEIPSMPPGGAARYDGVRMVTYGNGGTSVAADMESTAFVLDWREEGGPERTCYSVDPVTRNLYVFFNAAKGDTITFTIDLTVENGAQAYADCAEVVWPFVPWFRHHGSNNVDVTLMLPLPAGASAVAGENVWAWSHSPEGSVFDVNPDGVVSFQTEKVDALTQSVSLRVCFPAEWLENLSEESLALHKGEKHLEWAKEYEAEWEDDTEAQRQGGIIATMVWPGIGLFALVIALIVFAACGRKPSDSAIAAVDEGTVAQLKNTLEAHPGIAGRAARWNHEDGDDLVAELQSLAERGLISVHVMTPAEAGETGEAAEAGETGEAAVAADVEIVLNAEAAAAKDALDQATLTLLELFAQDGRTTLTKLEQLSQANARTYAHAVRDWQHTLTGATFAAGILDKRSFAWQKRLFVLALILLVIGIAGWRSANSWIPLVSCVIPAIIIAFVANDMPRRTPAAIVLQGMTDIEGAPAPVPAGPAKAAFPTQQLRDTLARAWEGSTKANGLSPILDEEAEQAAAKEV